jgi:LMBR1 domain-containing protein 1
LRRRIQSALLWTLLAVAVFGAILGLVYAINGFVEYDTTLLTSGLTAIQNVQQLRGCLPSPGTAADGCSAVVAGATTQVWKERPSFPIFVIAVASILGWLLLMVMGGVGLIALPLDMIMSCAAACSTQCCQGCTFVRSSGYLA